MNKVGIWLDKEKAHIVTLKDKTENFKTIFSELEFFHPKGGSGTKLKGGPQDVVQDSKYLELEIHQLNRYFNTIAESVSKANELVLFGPGQTNEKFQKELLLSQPKIAAKIKAVIKADSMTNNQVKALVRDYYKAV